MAKTCNREVQVAGSTSETNLAVAEPSGKIRWTQNVAPVRVKRGSSWVAVDTNLRLVNGSPAPVASVVDVQFSKGGGDPLITVKDRGGSVSVSWPAALPVPVLDGDAAVYPEVFAGVDLRVRATSTGFTHVLVVKNAAAAANPALRSVKYRWSGAGLSVRPAADGTIEIIDPLGSPVLTSAPASMWDSDTGTVPAAAHQSLTVGGSAENAMADGTAAPSDPDSAGDAATVAPVTATATATEVTVTPDPAMLASAPTLVYPLFIDPTFGLPKQRWAWMSSNQPNSSDSHARAGNNPDGAGIFRSMFQFDITGLHGKTVYDAKFNTVLYHSSSCTDTPVSLWYGQDIPGGVANGARTAWRSDQLITYLEEKWGHANKGGGCSDSPQPDKPMEFTASSLATRIQQSVNLNWNFITLTLSTANWNQQGESDTSWWKKFWWANTSVTVWHNASPLTPTVQAFNGTTDCYKACTPATVSANITHSDGWWKLRETSGSTAADSSGKGRNGTATNVTWTDNSAAFAGNGIIATASPVLNTSESFTVSAWAKISNTSTYMNIAGQAGTANNGFFLQYSLAYNAWSFLTPASDANPPSGYHQATASTPPALNTWVFLTGVYDKSAQTMKLYVNNSLTATGTKPSAWNATGTFRIGASGTGWDPVNGAVSNVQAYQRALSNTEISALYTSGRLGGALQPAVVRTTTPELKVTVSDPDNGVLDTDFEVRTAPSDTATLLASGRVEDRSSGTAVPWTVTAGKLAANGTYFWRARAVDEITWVSPWTSWQVLKVDTTAPAAPTTSSAQYPASQWGALVGTQGTFALSDTAVDTHEFEWRVDNDPWKVADAVGTSPRTANATWTPATDMVHTMTVKAKDAAGNTSSNSTHQFWVKPTANRCWLWTLNENAGATTAADTGKAECSPADNTIAASNGTVSGATFGPGHLANAAVFDGSNDQITTSGPVLDTTKSFTVMAWAKRDANASPAYQTVLGQDGANVSGFNLQYNEAANNGAGGWCFTMRGTDSTTASVTSACATSEPAVGEWVHLAGVRDTVTGKIRVYVMGDPEGCGGEVAEMPYTAAWSAGGAFTIGRGRYSGAAADFWHGGIDDVRAYQRVLSAAEICQQAIS